MISPEKLQELIDHGEGLTTELKRCRNKLTKEAYATICAFLNRQGGHLILGVEDSGAISGIDPQCIDQIKKDFVANLNNTQKIHPSVYLVLDSVQLEGKSILHTYVPPSSSVHNTNGKIYDRNEDGDFDIAHNTLLVAEMFLRKQQSYTENKVYPYIEMSD